MRSPGELCLDRCLRDRSAGHWKRRDAAYDPDRREDALSAPAVWSAPCIRRKALMSSRWPGQQAARFEVIEFACPTPRRLERIRCIVCGKSDRWAITRALPDSAATAKRCTSFLGCWMRLFRGFPASCHDKEQKGRRNDCTYQSNGRTIHVVSPFSFGKRVSSKSL